MKGILFGGCSFTWGQGLYHYSDLERLHHTDKSYLFNPNDVTTAQLRMMRSIRFSRLVANHFGTFDFQKIQNGGSEDVNFEFINSMFHPGPNNAIKSPHLTNETYDYDDFDFFILQTSQLYRNRFNFTLNDEPQSSIIWNSANGSNVENFKKWMFKNDLDIDEWAEIFKNLQIKRLIEKFQFLESKGIKCRFLCWEDDLMEKIKSNEYLNKRLITLEYNLVRYNTIARMMHINRYLEISRDFDNFIEPPKDHHPSKKCHEIIADSIIKNLEKTGNIKKTKLPRKRKELTLIEKDYDFSFDTDTLPELIDKTFYLSDEFWNIIINEPENEEVIEEDEVEGEIIEDQELTSNFNTEINNNLEESVEVVNAEMPFVDPPMHVKNIKPQEVKYDFESYFLLYCDVNDLIIAPEPQQKTKLEIKKSMI
jgi:hypothetical protein